MVCILRVLIFGGCFLEATMAYLFSGNSLEVLRMKRVRFPRGLGDSSVRGHFSFPGFLVWSLVNCLCVWPSGV